VLVEPVENDGALGQPAEQKMPVDQLRLAEAVGGSAGVIAPGGRVEDHELVGSQAQRTSDLSAPGAVVVDQDVVAGIAELQDLALVPEGAAIDVGVGPARGEQIVPL